MCSGIKKKFKKNQSHKANTYANNNSDNQIGVMNKSEIDENDLESSFDESNNDVESNLEGSNLNYNKGLSKSSFKSLSLDEYWKAITPLALNVGVMLYDIEVPKVNNSFLKVYILPNLDSTHSEDSKENNIESKQPVSVQHEDCVKLSRYILDSPRVEELLPANTQLEVSSPGINRYLTRPEHFKISIGERVSVTGKFEDKPENKLVNSSDEPQTPETHIRNKTVKGKLNAFEYDIESKKGTISMIDEESKNLINIEYSKVTKARIDFDFLKA